MATKKATQYYMIDCRMPDAALLENIQDVGIESWFGGHRFSTEPETPVVLEILEGYESRPLKEFFPSEMLMRDELVETIRSAGVDNLDVYDAVIRNRKHGRDHTGYKAVNVIGVLAAADGEGTEYFAENPSRLVDADIMSLQIDGLKTGGALMFRLAETVTGLVVHEKVKRAVEAAGFPNMVFHHPADWAG